MLHYEPWVRERFAPGRLLTISADTGSEHKETREHVRYLEAFYASVGEHFEHVTADKGYHTEKWPSLEHFYSSGERRRIGSKSFKRSCTWQLKLAHGRSDDRKDNRVKVDSVIYTIVCTANGRLYVGSALSFGVRKRIHLSDLNHGRHHSRHLQRAWDKYPSTLRKVAAALHIDVRTLATHPSEPWL